MKKNCFRKPIEIFLEITGEHEFELPLPCRMKRYSAKSEALPGLPTVASNSPHGDFFEVEVVRVCRRFRHTHWAAILRWRVSVPHIVTLTAE